LKERFGIWQWGRVSTDDLQIHQEVRDICKGDGCHCYATNWACPPAYGELDECTARVMRYQTVWVFTVKYDLEDSFDFEGMAEGGKRFKEVAANVRDYAREVTGGDCMVLANGGCNLCAKCTYPDAPCRFPDKMMESLEGYGVLVNRLAASANVKYMNGPNTVTYFGVVICDRK